MTREEFTALYGYRSTDRADDAKRFQIDLDALLAAERERCADAIRQVIEFTRKNGQLLPTAREVENVIRSLE